MLSPTDLKTGKIFRENDKPFEVFSYKHTKTARGSANIKIKARNLIDGTVIERSYNQSQLVDEASVDRENAQFLYSDETFSYFMNPQTYEQMQINNSLVGESKKYLSEGEKVQIVYFDGTVVKVQLPLNAVFEVVYTEPGFKGNTVSNVMKEAKLPNGTIVKVPTFIKIGDKVKIDTRTGEYLSKA